MLDISFKDLQGVLERLSHGTYVHLSQTNQPKKKSNFFLSVEEEEEEEEEEEGMRIRLGEWRRQNKTLQNTGRMGGLICFSLCEAQATETEE